MPSQCLHFSSLKRYLELVGAKRADLHTTDATRKAITFHDLRATGITWAAARGDEPLRIMQRAGHASFDTTRIYLREAENLAAGFGTVFPALPEALLSKPTSARGVREGVSASVSAFRLREPGGRDKPGRDPSASGASGRSKNLEDNSRWDDGAGGKAAKHFATPAGIEPALPA